jgi:Spy/CpxP family protein refolding chaperone
MRSTSLRKNLAVGHLNWLGLMAALVLALPLHAQQAPYAGQQQRSIKALSDDEVAQYLAGAGMSYAKAAELNHYPGPMHVLELAKQLGLSAEQRGQTERLMAEHKAEARELGRKVLDAERALDELFRAATPSAVELSAKVKAAAGALGEFRLAHLETHRRLRSILTDAQVARYDTLRGYGNAPAQTHNHKH